MDHEHFVQGVSWDPRNKYILTQSSDKSVRFYKNTQSKIEMKFIYINQLKRFEIKNKNNINENNIQNTEKDKQNKMEIENNKINHPNKNNNNKKEKDSQQKNSIAYHYYFADEDQSSSFIRRNTFSPDGKICLLVAGININEENNNELEFCVWGMSRKDFSHPLFYIPTLDKSSTCCRFCPIIFEKPPKEENDNFPELIDIPYLMYFAIGTIDSLFIYGTNSIKPKYAITNIHYQSITDLAWNGDKMLAVSSGDGYISFCVFEEGELGKRIDVEKLSFDEKFMNSYKNYLEIDIKKNVMKSNLNNTVIVKPKRKNKNLENKEGNEINNNNINNMDIEKDKKGNETNNNNINNMDIDKEKKENEINNIDFDKEKKGNETNNNNINNMDIEKEKKEQNLNDNNNKKDLMDIEQNIQ
jgi:chromatin assembly factor 1 subunit B